VVDGFPSLAARSLHHIFEEAIELAMVQRALEVAKEEVRGVS
jgi:hypothetical protein